MSIRKWINKLRMIRKVVKHENMILITLTDDDFRIMVREGVEGDFDVTATYSGMQEFQALGIIKAAAEEIDPVDLMMREIDFKGNIDFTQN